MFGSDLGPACSAAVCSCHSQRLLWSRAVTAGCWTPISAHRARSLLLNDTTLRNNQPPDVVSHVQLTGRNRYKTRGGGVWDSTREESNASSLVTFDPQHLHVLFLSEGSREKGATNGYSGESSDPEQGVVGAPSLSIMPCRGGELTRSLRSDGLRVLWPSLSHSLTSLLSLPSQGSALLVMAWNTIRVTPSVCRRSEKAPPKQVGVKSQCDRLKQRGLVQRADL